MHLAAQLLRAAAATLAGLLLAQAVAFSFDGEPQGASTYAAFYVAAAVLGATVVGITIWLHRAGDKSNRQPLGVVADHGSVAGQAGRDAFIAGRDIYVASPGTSAASPTAEKRPALGFGPAWHKREWISSRPGGDQGEWAEFVGVYVQNAGGAAAQHAWAEITISATSGEVLRSFQGRWSEGPLPELGHAFEGAEFTQREIPPNGRSEPLDVAVRFDADGVLNGFNTRNLFSGGRHDEQFSIDADSFVVKITIRADGGESIEGRWECKKEDFRLVRSGEAPTISGDELRVLARAESELRDIRDALVRAQRDGYLQSSALPDWARCHEAGDVFTNHRLHEDRRTLDEARRAIAGLSDDLAPRRWSGGPIPELIYPELLDDDDVPGVVAKIDAAIAVLQQERG